jgi:aromatic ring-cleaving dioxygenase
MPRTFDFNDFKKDIIQVKTTQLSSAPKGNPNTDEIFEDRMKTLVTWLDLHCTGLYLILLHSVIFEEEKDALIFKIGFKYERT